MSLLVVSAKGSFEDCDQKFKVEILKAGEKRKLGSSSLRRKMKLTW